MASLHVSSNYYLPAFSRCISGTEKQLTISHHTPPLVELLEHVMQNCNLGFISFYRKLYYYCEVQLVMRFNDNESRTNINLNVGDDV